MGTLKRGQIAVNKKSLIDHCQTLHQALNYLDKVMLEKESVDRGKKIAKVYNAINFSLHSIEHFELKIPLDKLGKKCKLSNKEIIKQNAVCTFKKECEYKNEQTGCDNKEYCAYKIDGFDLLNPDEIIDFIKEVAEWKNESSSTRLRLLAKNLLKQI